MIVVGGGHAGTEAARAGAETLLQQTVSDPVVDGDTVHGVVIGIGVRIPEASR